MPLSAQAAVGDPTSIPTGESAVRVLSALAVADQTDEASVTVASEPLASTGVGAMGALALFATLVLAAGAGLALAPHGRD